MTAKIDCIVVGAGIIGLAAGRRLALAGLEVAVLEAEDRIGCHSSSRNSEVIHAGIYYPANTFKARLCVAGKLALYDYCAARGVPHARLGKLVVATDSAEAPRLAEIERRAAANGVGDLRSLTADEVAALEPAARVTAGLLSPSTGIIDSHAYLLSLQADLERAGGAVVLRSPVSSVGVTGDGFEVRVGEDDREPVVSRFLVNAAGLWAPDVARSIASTSRLAPEAAYLARGHYFSYAGKSPFRHLVYPLPTDGGLGIHSTNDLAGRARFGPDVRWIDRVDYRFAEGLKEIFVDSIRRYFPAVDPDKLSPSYTGIRPKLAGPGMPAADFAIEGPPRHGVPGLVNLFGLESPGLTASLAIADLVHDLLMGASGS